jgi:hypothetical protein
MSLAATIQRIHEIQATTAPRPAAAAVALAAPAVGTAPVAGGVPTAFAAALQGVGGGGTGQRMLEIAAREVGQAEYPPGSNNSARIAQYRTATAGSMVAPWCGYFVSWVAAQAGAPIGENGQGLGSVDAIWAWAQANGRAQPAAQGPPQHGDLIVWDEHIGIVESVGPDGSIHTIEGNSSDQVARRVHPAGDAIGYVRMS